MASPELEPRVAALEVRIEEVAADAAAARHLAVARDQQLADCAVKIDANRQAINALGVQTAARFDGLETKVDANRAAITALGVQTAARFDRLETKVDANRQAINALGVQTAARFERVDEGFTEIRGRLDQTAAGFEHIGSLLAILIERDQR